MNKYQVNTKGACFLCCSNKTGGDEHVSNERRSLSDLSRFLHLDSATVFTMPNIMNETDVLVSLCKTCSPVVNQFGQLYEEMESIQLKMTSCLDTIHHVMTGGEAGSDPFEGNQQGLQLASDQEQDNNAMIVENLRNEVIRKCELFLKVPSFPFEFTSQMKSLPIKDNMILVSAQVIPYKPEMTEGNAMDCFGTDSIYDDNVAKTNNDENPISNQVVPDGLIQNPELAGPDPDDIIRSSFTTGNLHVKREVECKFCPGIFQTDLDLGMHTLDYHLSILFPPLMCPTIPPEELESATLHLFENLSNNKDNMLFCGYCKDSFSHSQNLKCHLITNHYFELVHQLNGRRRSEATQSTPKNLPSEFSANLICVICNKTFTKQGSLNEHTAIFHTGEKPHKCSHCPLSFETRHRIEAHIVKCHLADILSNCKDDAMSIDHFKKTVESLWTKNLSFSWRERRAVCKICLKEYKNRNNCQYHIMTNHRLELAAQLQGSVEND